MTCLDDTALSALISLGEHRNVRRGEHLESATFIVFSGIVKRWWSVPPHHRLLRDLVVAPALVLASSSCRSSALTSLEVVEIDPRAFDAFVDRHPALLRAVVAEHVSAENAVLTRLRERATPLPERLASLLCAYATAFCVPDHLERVSIAQTTLASDLGVVDRSVANALAELEGRALVRRARGGIELLDRPALDALASSLAAQTDGGITTRA